MVDEVADDIEVGTRRLALSPACCLRVAALPQLPPALVRPARVELGGLDGPGRAQLARRQPAVRRARGSTARRDPERQPPCANPCVHAYRRCARRPTRAAAADVRDTGRGDGARLRPRHAGRNRRRRVLDGTRGRGRPRHHAVLQHAGTAVTDLGACASGLADERHRAQLRHTELDACGRATDRGAVLHHAVRHRGGVLLQRTHVRRGTHRPRDHGGTTAAEARAQWHALRPLRRVRVHQPHGRTADARHPRDRADGVWNALPGDVGRRGEGRARRGWRGLRGTHRSHGSGRRYGRALHRLAAVDRAERLIMLVGLAPSASQSSSSLPRRGSSCRWSRSPPSE